MTRQYRATADHLSPVLRVVVESGAIYSLTIVAALVSFLVRSPGADVVLDIVRKSLLS